MFFGYSILKQINLTVINELYFMSCAASYFRTFDPPIDFLYTVQPLKLNKRGRNTSNIRKAHNIAQKMQVRNLTCYYK